MKPIEELDVYFVAMQVAEDTYKITKDFPKEETYGLISQMRRAAVSINSNLSEGGARITNGEKKHFFGMARGSAAELKFQFELSKRLGYAESENIKVIMNEIERIRKMITGLINRISDLQSPISKGEQNV